MFDIPFPASIAMNIASPVVAADYCVAQGLIIDLEGNAIPFRLANAPAGTPSRTSVSVPPGKLVAMQVTAGQNLALVQGQNQVTIELWNGPVATAQLVGIIARGYPIPLSPLGLGEIQPIASAELYNAFPLIASNPAAGAEFSYIPSTYGVVQLRSFSYLFTADANVATRTLEISLRDGSGGVYWRGYSTATVTAGLTKRVHWAVEGQANVANAAGDAISCQLPRLSMLTSDRLVTITGNRQVGDQYSDIMLQVVKTPVWS